VKLIGQRLVVFGSRGQELERGTFSSFPSNALTVPGFGGMHHVMYFLAEPVHVSDSLYELGKKFPQTAGTTVSEVESAGSSTTTSVHHNSSATDMIGKGSTSSPGSEKKRPSSGEDDEYLKKLHYSMHHPFKVSRVEFEGKKAKNKKSKHKFDVLDGQ
jgi:hypothetical protein